MDGTFCLISFQYLDVNISFPFMVLVKKLPATIPFGNCDAPPFLPRGITMAILPGLYSLRLLCSFSLLIFSATTSEEKTQQCCSSEFIYLFTYLFTFLSFFLSLFIDSLIHSFIHSFIHLNIYHCFPQKHLGFSRPLGNLMFLKLASTETLYCFKIEISSL